MEKVKDKIYKISGDSNVYFLDFYTKIIIDTSCYENRELVKKELKGKLEQIEIVIFTHLHYDHIGNWDLFKNAKFYASSDEIKFFEKNPLGSVLNKEVLKNFKVKLLYLEELDLKSLGLKLISTPGHTVGSICLLYEDVLFSGDTLFEEGYGRLDLPSSKPAEMKKSLEILKKIKFKILCPGHDY